MEMLSWLNYGWVGSMIGILGLISGYVLYKKSVKKTNPCYQYRTNTIIGKKSDDVSKDIEIKFKGKEVDNIKRTVIAIWNDGNDYLDSKRILEEKPLTISFEDGEILSHQVKSQTSTALTTHTEQGKSNEIFIYFNYLDAKEGFCIEIMHTSEKFEPMVSCTIKGIKAGFSNKGKIMQIAPLRTSRIIKYFTPLFGVILALGGFITLHLDAMKNLGEEDFITKTSDYFKSFKFIHILNESTINGWLFLILGITYIVIPFAFNLLYRPKTPKSMDVN